MNTYPTSDKGEPHTQEHLLVGKGNKGRMLAESETMTLTGFTAFTMQWRTCYPFNTQAGPHVFYQNLNGCSTPFFIPITPTRRFAAKSATSASPRIRQPTNSASKKKEPSITR